MCTEDIIHCTLFALQGPRAQIDRALYKRHLQEEVFSTPGLTVLAAGVDDLFITPTNTESSTGTAAHTCTGVICGKISPMTVGSRAFSVAAPKLWNRLPLNIRSAKTQISFRKKLKTYFFVRLFRLESSVVQLAQTTNADNFGTMSQITIMFVAPLCSDHRWFRHYRSLLLL